MAKQSGKSVSGGLTRTVLLIMAICSFAIGSTEFITTGLLPNIANSFSISIPLAAWVTTGYALGVAIFGPILTILTIKLHRKNVLLFLFLLFVVGSIISALSHSFCSLMAGRLISAATHGAFFGIGAVVVSTLAGPKKASSAIALMFSGLTVANVVGIPLGTLMGHHLGWHSVFWVITALGVLGFLGLFFFLPRRIGVTSTNLREEFSNFKNKEVWFALLITGIGFSGVIAAFAYIAPMMVKVTGFTPTDVSWLLCLFGVGFVIGNIIGGRAADKALVPTLYVLFIILILLLLGFTFSAHYKLLAAINLFFLGLVGFALVSPLQSYVLSKSHCATVLASTFNIAAFNAGVALSVFIGGVTIHMGYGYTSPCIVGAALAFIGLALLFVTNLKKKPK